LTAALAVTMCPHSNQTVSNRAGKMGPGKFSVTLDIFTHGDYKIYMYKINESAIKAVKYSTNNEPPQTFVNRKLKKEETENMRNFLAVFPLDKLKKEYINRRVEGEIHSVYDIRIGRRHKKIMVYFYKQKDLCDLSKEISRLLPAEHGLGCD